MRTVRPEKFVILSKKFSDTLNDLPSEGQKPKSAFPWKVKNSFLTRSNLTFREKAKKNLRRSIFLWKFDLPRSPRLECDLIEMMEAEQIGCSCIAVHKIASGSIWLTVNFISMAKEISCPKASNGQRFPCPALLFSALMGGRRAAALIGDKVL